VFLFWAAVCNDSHPDTVPASKKAFQKIITEKQPAVLVSMMKL
jgi:hypothetical protein